MLQSPTNKDFFQIFEVSCSRFQDDFSETFPCQFIYKFLVPNYKGSGKKEEEIPRLVKDMGYPFNITRSALLSVGSPHVWPTLLAMLAWMCNIIEVGV
jgi:kinetochore protein NDC80